MSNNLKDNNAKELKNPLHEITTAHGDLKETRYKTEIDLAEKYIAFTSEIFRVALLGMRY